MSTSDFAGWLGEARQHGLAERECVCQPPWAGTTFPRATTAVRSPAIVTAAGLRGRHGATSPCSAISKIACVRVRRCEAIGQLAGGNAHDFNNLLTAIVLGYADCSIASCTAIRAAGKVAEIQKAAERASDLTRQLLSFSRVNAAAGGDRSHLSSVRDLLPMLRRLIGEQNRDRGRHGADAGVGPRRSQSGRSRDSQSGAQRARLPCRRVAG
jgi:hypothetical protein